MKDYYKILNLTSTATDEAIKNSYRTLAKLYHPDVNPSASAAKRFAEVNEAYDVLTDAQKRAKYDADVKAERDRAKARAEAQAYAKAQTANPNTTNAEFEARIQADANAVINAVADESYKKGYSDGYGKADANAKQLSATIEKLNAEIAALKKAALGYKNDRGELEAELFERDRELARETDRTRELEAQIQWLRQASDTGSGNSVSAHVDSARQRILAIQATLNATGNKAVGADDIIRAQYDRRKEMNEQLSKLDKGLQMLSDELADMDAQLARRRKLNETETLITSMKDSAKQWAKKRREDMKLAKNTLYGSLGVLIWATDEEIEKAYNELFARPEITPEERKQLKTAYSTLSDPKSRAEYDRSIGYTEEKIIHEQVLVKENEKLQQEYRDKIADHEFWSNFDKLSALALSGDSHAQNALGEIYYKGDIIERDLRNAVYWFKEAFAARNPAAMYNLGVCYKNGEGVHRNNTIAEALFRQAALRGYNGN